VINKILNNTLVKQTSTLASGFVIAQIIGLLATPILSRYYLPEDFGFLGSVLTISSVLAVLLSLKYEMAIMLSNKPMEARGLVSLSLILLLLISILLLLIIFWHPTILTLVGLHNTSTSVITGLFIIIVGTGLQNIFYQWHSKLENYSIMSKNRIAQKLTIVLFQFLFIVFLSNHLGLVWGYAIGLIGSLTILIYPLKKEVLILVFKQNYLKLLAKKYYRFSCYTTPQNLLNAISQGLPILMLGYFFDLKMVGFYFFAVRILQLPSSIISGSVRQVFYKRASDLKNNIPTLKKEFLKTTRGLFLVIVFPVIIIFFYGPDLFSIIFGTDWKVAGELGSWLFLWVGLMFVNPPSQAILLVINKNKQQLYLDLFLVISRAFVLFIGGITGDIVFTIMLYSIVGVLFNVILILLSFKYLTEWK
tara:strand:+ start:792 stop:2048 length:1257 start_codon:yes stop_codon:yes gene_type:complete